MFISFTSTALLVGLAGTLAMAERSDGTTICDYYARAQYGTNNLTTQLKLMSSIIAYAYAGGSVLDDALDNSTGIFYPGVYKGTTIHLRPWFDGTKKTTNFNDAAVGMDWLDGGGTEPLLSFINGTTDTAEIKTKTNQFTLFTHWYVAFGRIYGCSRVEDFVDKKYKTLMPAYVHKYMDLDERQIAYFIQQIIIASQYYGFSDTDAQTLEQFMNARYNTRCAPADNGQLYSICLSVKGCPLAAPKSDCDAYNNVQPYSVDNTSAVSTSGSDTGTGTTTTTTSTVSAGAGEAADRSSLGGGAIAGITVGAVAGIVALLSVVAFFLLKKRRDRKRPESTTVSHGPSGTGDQAETVYYTPQMQQSPSGMDRQSQYTFTSMPSRVSSQLPPPHQHYSGTEPYMSFFSDGIRHELEGQPVGETTKSTEPEGELNAGVNQRAELESTRLPAR